MTTDIVDQKRWMVIAGALVVQVILGTVYAFSVFVRPLEAEFGWDRTTTQWAFSFALASFAASMIPAGQLQDRIGPRKVASIGGILLGLSFLLGAIFVAGDRPWALYLTYGVLGGAGIGFAYVCPIAALVKWYPDKKGLITGLAVAGFGAGALFFAGPASDLLSPPGRVPTPSGSRRFSLSASASDEGTGFGMGWRAFFMLHGVVVALSPCCWGRRCCATRPRAGHRRDGARRRRPSSRIATWTGGTCSTRHSLPCCG